MEEKKFKKYLKKYSPKQLINLHCNWNIKLTSKQLDEVIYLKNKKEGN